MLQANKSFTQKFIIISILVVFISACSSIAPYKVPILQGNIIEKDDIEKLEEGLTKDQVQFIFGTALLKDPFHSNRWDYYYSIQVGTETLDEKKLIIIFDENDLVESWIIEENIKTN